MPASDGDRRGPQAGRVHHGSRGDALPARETDAFDRPARDVEGDDLRSLLDGDAGAGGRPGEARRDPGRVTVARLGLPDRRAHRVGIDARVELPDVVGADQPRVDAEPALGLHGSRQGVLLAGAHREQRAALDVSRVPAAGDLREGLEHAKRVQHHPRARVGGIELPHDPHRPPRAAGRQESPLQHEDVAHALLREVEGDRAAGDPAPDDHHVGGSRRTSACGHQPGRCVFIRVIVASMTGSSRWLAM